MMRLATVLIAVSFSCYVNAAPVAHLGRGTDAANARARAEYAQIDARLQRLEVRAEDAATRAQREETDIRSISDDLARTKQRYDDKLEQKSSVDRQIAIGSLLLSIVSMCVTIWLTAYWVPRINKRTTESFERKKLSLEVWDQFISKYIELGDVIKLLRSPPEKMTEDGLDKIRALRNWLEGLATMATDLSLTDKTITDRLDLVTPMRDFMTVLKAALDKARQYPQPAAGGVQNQEQKIAQYVAEELARELDASPGIKRFCGI
ncbi:hypothetical protein LJ656_06955 [Paraburkholderia sp. MMS20-SJTR3]|uniref:Uncharacterized protein n=1 Tax=Paraburkholderia sejongensis TaxID=2886946 RepID=A0ABS8JR68_9BURK|nr:hypothetical protein [Paraburkholderia sp. MMS20-SJTR3]MCC8392322.1 hypothetical protein [Paraburkholderia sp. MMS20-SJTR3]